MAENISQSKGKVWLFYAAAEQRGAKWLEQAHEGGYVFWRHGNDAHTKTMRPGDTALIYLAGSEGLPARIVAIAAIAAVRTPFILDNSQKVQRIPALIVRDLRESPLSSDELAKYTGDDTLRLVRGRGAVHQVDDKVTRALTSLVNLDFPLAAHKYAERILSSNLWSEILRYSDNFTVLEHYLPANKRKQFDPESVARVTSEEQFQSLLEAGWYKPDVDITETAKTKKDSRKSKAEGGSPDSDVSANTNTTPESVQNDEDRQPDDLQPKYSEIGILTASGIADRVTVDAKDHLRVEKEARAFARLIASESSKPPLSIGIFGRWGSGKTFFMTRISKELKDISDHHASGFHSNIVQVDFNAWHYMETNIWASLVDVIFKRLDEEVSYHGEDDNDKFSLFDQLSTSQNLRLDAIENLARKTQAAKTARLAVKKAREAYRKHGPNGEAVWSMIYKKIFADGGKIDSAELKKTAEYFGIEGFRHDMESLRRLGDSIRKSQQQGHLAIQLLRKQAINPLSAVIFAGAVTCFALSQMDIPLFSWLPKLNLQATLSTIVAGVSTWGASILIFANRAIKLIEKVGSGLSEAEQLAVSKQQSALDQAQLDLEEANRNLELAEKNADAAYQTLTEHSPGAQLATFIRQRSESDDYSKHLGVIATIRKDFEQLSALMSTQRTNINDSEEEKNESWQEVIKFRESISARIDYLEKDYSNILADESNTIENERIKGAIEQLRKTLSKPTEIEQPFSRIVLKVDDLDRCPPEKVADVLQAIHLFLNFPLFVILVCVDERWMSSSLIAKYQGLLDGSSGSTTKDYLEKIFQIPYWTRPMSMDASGEFARDLVDSIPHTNNINQLKITSEPESGDIRDAPVPNEENEVIESSDSNKDIKSESIGTNEYSSEPVTKGEPKPDSIESSKNEESSNNSIQYSPLSLAVDEREFLVKVVGFAGDTPRRTLRLVNVYLLIKSSIETNPEASDFVDLQGNRFGYQALLIQLSLATRADAIADVFFQTLQNFRFTSGTGLDKFLKSFEGKIYSTEIRELTSVEQNICEKLINLVLESVDALGKNGEESSKDRYSLLSKSPNNKLFLEDFYRTHYLARRYTFVPPSD